MLPGGLHAREELFAQLAIRRKARQLACLLHALYWLPHQVVVLHLPLGILVRRRRRRQEILGATRQRRQGLAQGLLDLLTATALEPDHVSISLLLR